MDENEQGFWGALIGLCVFILMWGLILGITNGGHDSDGGVIPPFFYFIMSTFNLIGIVFTAIEVWKQINILRE